MGNLGRAGYGASLEGLWPYSYDTCDVGTVANQSVNGIPAASVDGTGDIYNNGALSYLPGTFQRDSDGLSKISCRPKVSDYLDALAPDNRTLALYIPMERMSDAQLLKSVCGLS